MSLIFSKKFSKYYKSLDTVELIPKCNSNDEAFVAFKLKLNFDRLDNIYDKEEIILKLMNNLDFNLVELPIGIDNLYVDLESKISGRFFLFYYSQYN